MPIATQPQFDDLVPYNVTIDVNGEVHLGDSVGTICAAGGWELQVPTGSSAVYVGATGVSATASDAARGREILAGASFQTDSQNLTGWYVTGTATRLTLLGKRSRLST